MIQFTQKDLAFARHLCSIFDNCRAPCLLVNDTSYWCDGCLLYEFADVLNSCGARLVIINALGLYRYHTDVKPDNVCFTKKIIYAAAVMYSANNRSSPMISQRRIYKLINILQGNPQAFINMVCKKIDDPNRFWWIPAFNGECKKEGVTKPLWNIIMFVILSFIIGMDEEEERDKNGLEKKKEKLQPTPIKKLTPELSDLTPEEFFRLHSRGENR